MYVSLEDVSLAYEGAPGEKVLALDGVTLTFDAGVTGVMGRTGSGKSTLLEVLAGALRPDSGHLLADGRDLLHGDAARGYADQIGLVFQIPERQFFEPTVEQEVAFGLLARGIAPREARRRAACALELLGLSLDELGRRSPFALSGGQQRRVAIASVLALRPRLLLLDEPTAGLDPRSREACLSAIRSAADDGSTVVVASHDANALARMADRVVTLEDGRVTLDGPVRDLLGNADLMGAHGLEAACAARAARALRRSGVAVAGSPLTAEELAAAIVLGRAS